MKGKSVGNSLVIAIVLLSRGSFAAPYLDSLYQTQASAEVQIEVADADVINTLQTELRIDLREEMLQRIKADSRQELSRQLQDTELFIDPLPATVNDFEITISNPDRKMRLTSR